MHKFFITFFKTVKPWHVFACYPIDSVTNLFVQSVMINGNCVFELQDILKTFRDCQVWTQMDFQIHIAVMMQYYRCYMKGRFP